MITKDDVVKKCLNHPALQSLAPIVSKHDFDENDLEVIDFMIEMVLSMQDSITRLQNLLIAKVEIWLASTKDTG